MQTPRFNTWSLQWTGLLTILRKETTRILRIWSQTLLPTVITTALYFLIFGKILGEKISLSSGIDFIHYIVPGLIMMAILNNSYSNTSSVVFGLKFSGAIEEEIISPLWTATILLGHVLGGVLRGLLVGALVLALSSCFATIKIHSYGLLIATALASALLFSLAGFFNALFARKFDDIAIIPSFVITPLTYLGGVFYSINQVPAFWQKIALANPILYIVNSARYAMLGTADMNPYFTFYLVIPLTALLTWVCIFLIHDGRRLRL